MPAPPTGVSEAPVSQYVPPAQSAPARAGQLDMPVAQLSDQSAAPPGQVRASEAGGVQASLQALQAHIKRLFDNDGFEEEFEYLESLTATRNFFFLFIFFSNFFFFFFFFFCIVVVFCLRLLYYFFCQINTFTHSPSLVLQSLHTSRRNTK